MRKPAIIRDCTSGRKGRPRSGASTLREKGADDHSRVISGNPLINHQCFVCGS